MVLTEEDPAAADAVDEEDGQDCEDPVCHGDDGPNCDGVRESYNVEEGGRVVHECVEATELLECHEAASCYGCSQIGGDGKDVLE